MANTWIQLKRNSKEVEELLKHEHNCFILLTQIALRAKRTNKFSAENLELGQALIGDYKSIGLTEQKYRTVKNKLKKWQFVTFKTTNKGTIATLLNTSIYDINIEKNNEQDNSRVTTEQRTDNERITTNKNVKKEKNANNEKKKDFILRLKEIFNYWNNGIGIKHLVLDDKIKAQINSTLKNYTIEQIKQGIDNYKFIRESPDHMDGSKWSLIQFLQQSNGLAVFLDLESVKSRYKKIIDKGGLL